MVTVVEAAPWLQAVITPSQAEELIHSHCYIATDYREAVWSSGRMSHTPAVLTGVNGGCHGSSFEGGKRSTAMAESQRPVAETN